MKITIKKTLDGMMSAIKTEDTKWCFTCAKYVEPEYVTKSCIAQYGTVVYSRGICPCCERTVEAERMVDDSGLHPDGWRW